MEPEKGNLDPNLNSLVEEAESIQKTHQYFNDTTADQESYKQVLPMPKLLFETSHAKNRLILLKKPNC